MARLSRCGTRASLPAHRRVPPLVIGVFIPAEFAAAGIPIFKSSRAHVAALVRGPVVGIWTAIGQVHLISLYSARPERVADTGKVFLEEGAPAAGGAV